MVEMIDIVWIGSRTKERHRFTFDVNGTVGEFKDCLWMNHHGTEIKETEIEWTASHNICMAKGGKILNDGKTFEELGMMKTFVPYELSFTLGLDGGGI